MGKSRRTKNEELALEEKFENFFKENYNRFYYYALRFIRDTEICRDIVSDSFQYMWERRHNFVFETARSYMYSHVHHLCIDYLRKENVKERNADKYLTFILGQSQEELQEREERIKKIMDIIKALPLTTRRVMELYYFERKKYKEVAFILGLSESGVRKHVMKGLSKIRECFSINYKKGRY